MPPEQSGQWQRDGYVIVRDLLPRDEFAELERAIDGVLDGQLRPERPGKDGVVPEDFSVTWEPETKDRTDLPRRQRVRLISWLAPHHGYFHRLAAHPRIYEMVSELFGGDDVKLFSDTIFVKPARHGIEAPPHQDSVFWPRLDPRAINFWMAIDPATVENGCLWIIPGSHVTELPHERGAHQSWLLRDDQIDAGRQIPIELPPNAAIFMDSALIHRSYGNRSDRSRRAMTAVYVAEHARHVEPWDEKFQFLPLARPRATPATSP
jgi:phytanoyl-CoA hydroxylase